MTFGRPARRWAALAAATLSLLALAAIRVGGGGGPPLYDGLCLPPHYLLLGGNPPPPSQSMVYTAADLAGTIELADTQNANPQAQIIIAAGSVVVPPGATTAALSIAAVRPPAVAPPDGTIEGNVYSFEVQSGGGQLALAAGHPATVVLEGTSSGGSQPTVEHFDGTRWTALKTFTAGCGTTYEAASPSLGLFALVTQGSPGSPTPPASGGPPLPLIVVGVLIVELALAIGATRLSRGRR